MKLAVIVPTYGRKDLVARTVSRLSRQSWLPDEVFVAAPDPSHLPEVGSEAFRVTHVLSAAGAVPQRNAALERVIGRFDVVVFFDDDFLPADDYLELTLECFEHNPDWVVLTGDVLRDGINNEGISFEEGEAVLASTRSDGLSSGNARDWHGGYGCNMSVRVGAIGPLRFDERLVLYGWQEDVDFTRRVAGHGRIIHHTSLRGVHMGLKTGRMSGRRLGYSQIVNPVYLARKGSLTRGRAALLISRNLCANFARSFWPEPWIDRRGRLRGNMIAASHLLSGRIEPEFVLEL